MTNYSVQRVSAFELAVISAKICIEDLFKNIWSTVPKSQEWGGGESFQFQLSARRKYTRITGSTGCLPGPYLHDVDPLKASGMQESLRSHGSMNTFFNGRTSCKSIHRQKVWSKFSCYHINDGKGAKLSNQI